MDPIAVAIALSGGSLVGLVAFYGLQQVGMRAQRAAAETEQGLEIEQVGEFLEAVPLPSVVVRRWGDPQAQATLLHAGIPWSGEALAAARWLGLWLSLILVAGIIVVRAGDLLSWFLALLMLGIGWQGIPVWLRLRVDQRRQAVDRALPDFIDRLTLSLEAGLGFDVALRRTAARFDSLLGEELRRAVRFFDRGHAKGDVLEGMLARVPSTDLGAFVAAVKQSERLGTSLTKTLRVQSDLLRARRRRRAEEASRRLPILIVFPLVLFFLPALLIVFLAPPLLHLFIGG